MFSVNINMIKKAWDGNQRKNEITYFPSSFNNKLFNDVATATRYDKN